MAGEKGSTGPDSQGARGAVRASLRGTQVGRRRRDFRGVCRPPATTLGVTRSPGHGGRAGAPPGVPSHGQGGSGGEASQVSTPNARETHPSPGGRRVVTAPWQGVPRAPVPDTVCPHRGPRSGPGLGAGEATRRHVPVAGTPCVFAHSQSCQALWI